MYAPKFGEGGPSYWSGKDKAFFLLVRVCRTDSRSRNHRPNRTHGKVYSSIRPAVSRRRSTF
jgi:hypothetical protein